MLRWVLLRFGERQIADYQPRKNDGGGEVKLVAINPIPLCKNCVYFGKGYCFYFMEESDGDESCDSFIKDESEDEE